MQKQWKTKYQIVETEYRYQIAKAAGKKKYQILQRRKIKSHSKK
jgi:hypothetical protein